MAAVRDVRRLIGQALRPLTRAHGQHGAERCPIVDARPNVLHGALCSPLFVASRAFYFPRKNWFPWRVRLIHHRRAALRQNRHIWPRKIDPEEKPIFIDKDEGVIAFRERHIKLTLKRLFEYSKMIKSRQIQDAIDWVESMSRMKSEPILRLLRHVMHQCAEKYRWDLARTYILTVQTSR
eukprot:4335179-Amphidinium_carterae.1